MSLKYLIVIIIILLVMIISVVVITYLQITPIWEENWEECKSISEERGAYSFYSYLDGECKLHFCNDDVPEIQIDNTTYRRRCSNLRYEFWER